VVFQENDKARLYHTHLSGLCECNRTFFHIPLYRVILITALSTKGEVMRNIRKTVVILLLPVLILAASTTPIYVAHSRRTFAIEVTYAPAAGGDISGIEESGEDVLVFPNRDQSLEITPNLGYHIYEVWVDGDRINAEDIYGEISYTFTKVKEDHTLTVIFEENAEVPGVTGAAISVLTEAPEFLPGFEFLPGLNGVTPFFEIEVKGSLPDVVTVIIHYEDIFPGEDEEEKLRLYIGNAVDFNDDGTVNGNDVALFQEFEKSGSYDEMFDLNNDNTVDILDERIVKEYANSGLIVSPGNDGVGEFRIPWIDITVEVIPAENIIIGQTWHLSIFGIR
jgi:hypothetical protein